MIETLILSSLTKVFENSKPDDKQIGFISMFKNERVSFQIAIKSDIDCNAFVEVNGFEGKTDIYKVESVPVGLASFENTDDYYLKKESGSYPDLLIPYDDNVYLKKDKWYSFWAELSADNISSGTNEIFVRINSEGVVLSQADFAMSKISVNEEYEGNDIRKVIDYFCHFAKTPVDYDNIKNNDIDFSKKDIFRQIEWIKDKNEDLYLPSYTDVLRVAFTYKFKRGKLADLVSLLSGRDFETREYREDIVESSFKTLYDGVKQFINQSNFERYIMILKSAGIIDDSLVRSQNVLNFGYILYLILREKNIEASKIQTLVRRWVVMSILTQRYTSSPESAFDYDIRRLNDNQDIEIYINEEIERQLSESFWTNYLVDRLNTPVTSSPFWKTFLAAQIFLGDRGFLSDSIKVQYLIENRGDVHHIFPKDYLQKNGYNNKQQYNQIANFTMLQTEINIAVSNRAPKDYMADVKAQCNGQENKYGLINSEEDLYKNLEESAIPKEIINMSVENYEEFLQKRRILMANKIKEYFYKL